MSWFYLIIISDIKAWVVNLKQMFHSNAAVTIVQKRTSFLNSHWSFRHHFIRADFAKFGTIFWVDSTMISIILVFESIGELEKCEKNYYSVDFHDFWRMTTCWQNKDSEFFYGKIFIAKNSKPRLLIKLGAWSSGFSIKASLDSLAPRLKHIVCYQAFILNERINSYFMHDRNLLIVNAW